jgi:hypothetical protein
LKFLVSAGLTTCGFAALLMQAAGQDTPSEQKHVIVPMNGNRGVKLSAISIERGASYPSVVTLKGDVEIRTPVCLPVGKKGSTVCDGEMIVHADEATFHEDTGEIEARGAVMVTPLRHETKK